MEVIILDNGLIGRGAHSYPIALALGAELARRGLGHRLFAARSVEPEVARETGAVPAFRRNLYDSVRRPHRAAKLARLMRPARPPPDGVSFDSARSEILTFNTLNRDYRRDLARLEDVWCPQNIVLAAGVSQNQLLGLVRHLLSLPASRRPTVIALLMFGPSWTPWGAQSRHGHGHYREIFRLAAPLIGNSLRLATETAELAAYYRDEFNLSPAILPIPLALDPVRRSPRQPGAAPILGYVGYAKTAKGFHLLPRTVEICRDRRLTVEFLIQVHHTAWEPAVIEAERSLAGADRVEIVKGELGRDDYHALFDRIDAVLLPYDPKEYGQRGSGILVEAVSAGCPVIASAGTWAAAAILAGQAEGEIFATFDAAALADAIQRLSLRWEQSRDKAAACAPAFAAANSAHACVSAILAARATGLS